MTYPNRYPNPCCSLYHAFFFSPFLRMSPEDRKSDMPPGDRSAGRSSESRVWNLRLEVGHLLAPEVVRTTELAPALPSVPAEAAAPPIPAQGYGPAEVALPWKRGRFSGHDFVLQPNGTLRCPAKQKLSAHERRREADESLRVVYGASTRSCRPCLLREQCQWQGRATAKPRQVSVRLASSRGSRCLRPLARLEPSEAAASLPAPSARSAGERSRWCRAALPAHPLRLLPCPMSRGHIGDSPGPSGWRATSVLQRQVQSRSRCLVFQTPSLAFSA